jgi:uncharacterized membrane protein YhaH (DUF805 family)
MTAASALRLWFGFSERVTRRRYLLSGLVLGAVKIAVDSALMIAWLGADHMAGRLPFVVPLREFLGATPAQGLQGWQLILVAWAIPFLWIGVSMTMRRAVDAGGTPWLGILFLVPWVNYVVMGALCLLPSRGPGTWEARVVSAARHPGFGYLVTILLVATGVGLGLGVTHVQRVATYSAALFMGVPFVTGALVGYLANREAPVSIAQTILLASMSQLLIAAGLLVVALEGVVCLLMAMPFAMTIAALGSYIGREIAHRRPQSPGFAALLLLAIPASDLWLPSPTPVNGMVLTAIEIAAPPEVVWRHVISFSELPPPREWLFHVGVAYPVRARITGHGIGAVRRCEFSTGAFVEPITAWDEPRRLAFDVAAAPLPMEEWSPYAHVYAAHLDSGFQSRRGEFRLIELPGGHTRLEGRTWYALDIHPSWYWGLYADGIVHLIHGRVLRHIRSLSEAEASRVASRRP